MAILTYVLLWLHFLGLAMGVGVGFAMSRVAPELIAAPAHERIQLWPLEKFLARLMAAGLGILLITGPLMLWLKFGGSASLGWSFWAKMAFVASTAVSVAVTRWAAARLENGDEGAAKVISVTRPLTGISAMLAMLFAVIAFN